MSWHARLALASGAELIGWDVVALGLPEAQLPFERGSLLQHIDAAWPRCSSPRTWAI